jgi:hypothetical protein
MNTLIVLWVFVYGPNWEGTGFFPTMEACLARVKVYITANSYTKKARYRCGPRGVDPTRLRR